MGRPFYIVDVFGEGRYTGNQLAVFRNAKSLSAREMQRIAREMNFAETTFIATDSQNRGGYDVRIFTPTAELPFAGHPTLGTAFVILQEVIRRRVKSVVLNLKAGRIPVTPVYSGRKLQLLWMKQKEPVFGPELEAAEAAAAIGLKAKDVDGRFPVQQVSTGIPFIIVPIRSREAVRRCRVSLDGYEKLTKGIPTTGVFVFCPEPYDRKNDFNARMFAPEYGVTEDPATGSANGCFAAYLVRHRYFGRSAIAARVEQGREIGRPSLLHIRASERGGAIEVNVGGKVSMVARGEFV